MVVAQGNIDLISIDGFDRRLFPAGGQREQRLPTKKGGGRMNVGPHETAVCREPRKTYAFIGRSDSLAPIRR